MAIALFQRPAEPAPRPRAIERWLLAAACLVFLMVVVGGITRLTESGLSMVRWEPLSGAIPPLNDEAWQQAFEQYKASPQYQQVNSGMTLADFKSIYFWEFVHRLLARIIGLFFALPLLFFWWKRAIPKGYGWKLGGLLALGALQGAIGWWMVASGLVDRPDVSHIRLAIHLLMALLIFAAMLWVAGDMRELARDPEAPPARMPLLAIWTLSLLFLQFMFGAYVAGLEAGRQFQTWPLMQGEFYPTGYEWMEPALRNFVDNPITVQFVHRWLAWPVALMAVWLAIRAWRRGLKVEAAMIVGAVALQINLGVLTLLSNVELYIAVAHQGMAVLLLGAIVATAHRLGTQRT
jgi:cytochrome c oxidase assembly protein subunit 15